jgi:hypothetical protein
MALEMMNASRIKLRIAKIIPPNIKGLEIARIFIPAHLIAIISFFLCACHKVNMIDMKIFNRYILLKWLRSFGCAYFVITSLLFLEDVYKNVCLFIKAKIAISELAEYYFLLRVSFFTIVVPISIFISAMFTLGQVHRKNEVIAMRCAGMNVFAISKPLVLGAIFLVIFKLIFEAFLIPSAIDYVTTFRRQTDFKAGYRTAANNVGFYNHIDNCLWVFKSLDKLLYTGKDGTMSCYDQNNQENQGSLLELPDFVWTKNTGSVKIVAE